MYKTHKLIDTKCSTPSSNLFKFYSQYRFDVFTQVLHNVECLPEKGLNPIITISLEVPTENEGSVDGPNHSRVLSPEVQQITYLKLTGERPNKMNERRIKL
jgi:hypothetical protein